MGMQNLSADAKLEPNGLTSAFAPETCTSIWLRPLDKKEQ